MKNLRFAICIFLLYAWMSIPVFAQKKVVKVLPKVPIVTAEKPVDRADTSIVTTAGQNYRKVISTRYELITEDILTEEYLEIERQTKQAIAAAEEAKNMADDELNRLKAKLNMSKNFYKTAAKDLKFSIKTAEDMEKVQAERLNEQKARNALIEIIDNPRKKQ